MVMDDKDAKELLEFLYLELSESPAGPYLHKAELKQLAIKINKHKSFIKNWFQGRRRDNGIKEDKPKKDSGDQTPTVTEKIEETIKKFKNKGTNHQKETVTRDTDQINNHVSSEAGPSGPPAKRPRFKKPLDPNGNANKTLKFLYYNLMASKNGPYLYDARLRELARKIEWTENQIKNWFEEKRESQKNSILYIPEPIAGVSKDSFVSEVISEAISVQDPFKNLKPFIFPPKAVSDSDMASFKVGGSFKDAFTMYKSKEVNIRNTKILKYIRHALSKFYNRHRINVTEMKFLSEKLNISVPSIMEWFEANKNKALPQRKLITEVNIMMSRTLSKQIEEEEEKRKKEALESSNGGSSSSAKNSNSGMVSTVTTSETKKSEASKSLVAVEKKTETVTASELSPNDTRALQSTSNGHVTEFDDIDDFFGDEPMLESPRNEVTHSKPSPDNQNGSESTNKIVAAPEAPQIDGKALSSSSGYSSGSMVSTEPQIRAKERRSPKPLPVDADKVETPISNGNSNGKPGEKAAETSTTHKAHLKSVSDALSRDGSRLEPSTNETVPLTSSLTKASEPIHKIVSPRTVVKPVRKESRPAFSNEGFSSPAGSSTGAMISTVTTSQANIFEASKPTTTAADQKAISTPKYVTNGTRAFQSSSNSPVTKPIIGKILLVANDKTNEQSGETIATFAPERVSETSAPHMAHLKPISDAPSSSTVTMSGLPTKKGAFSANDAGLATTYKASETPKNVQIPSMKRAAPKPLPPDVADKKSKLMDASEPVSKDTRSVESTSNHLVTKSVVENVSSSSKDQTHEKSHPYAPRADKKALQSTSQSPAAHLKHSELRVGDVTAPESQTNRIVSPEASKTTSNSFFASIDASSPRIATSDFSKTDVNTVGSISKLLATTKDTGNCLTIEEPTTAKNNLGETTAEETSSRKNTPLKLPTNKVNPLVQSLAAESSSQSLTRDSGSSSGNVQENIGAASTRRTLLTLALNNRIVADSLKRRPNEEDYSMTTSSPANDSDYDTDSEYEADDNGVMRRRVPRRLDAGLDEMMLPQYPIGYDPIPYRVEDVENSDIEDYEVQNEAPESPINDSEAIDTSTNYDPSSEENDAIPKSPEKEVETPGIAEEGASTSQSPSANERSLESPLEDVEDVIDDVAVTNSNNVIQAALRQLTNQFEVAESPELPVVREFSESPSDNNDDDEVDSERSSDTGEVSGDDESEDELSSEDEDEEEEEDSRNGKETDGPPMDVPPPKSVTNTVEKVIAMEHGDPSESSSPTTKLCSAGEQSMNKAVTQPVQTVCPPGVTLKSSTSESAPPVSISSDKGAFQSTSQPPAANRRCPVEYEEDVINDVVTSTNTNEGDANGESSENNIRPLELPVASKSLHMDDDESDAEDNSEDSDDDENEEHDEPSGSASTATKLSTGGMNQTLAETSYPSGTTSRPESSQSTSKSPAYIETDDDEIYSDCSSGTSGASSDDESENEDEDEEDSRNSMEIDGLSMKVLPPKSADNTVSEVIQHDKFSGSEHPTTNRCAVEKQPLTQLVKTVCPPDATSKISTSECAPPVSFSSDQNDFKSPPQPTAANKICPAEYEEVVIDDVVTSTNTNEGDGDGESSENNIQSPESPVASKSLQIEDDETGQEDTSEDSDDDENEKHDEPSGSASPIAILSSDGEQSMEQTLAKISYPSGTTSKPESSQSTSEFPAVIETDDDEREHESDFEDKDKDEEDSRNSIDPDAPKSLSEYYAQKLSMDLDTTPDPFTEYLAPPEPRIVCKVTGKYVTRDFKPCFDLKSEKVKLLCGLLCEPVELLCDQCQKVLDESEAHYNEMIIMRREAIEKNQNALRIDDSN